MEIGKCDPHAVNFVIRDIDTGKVREEFRTRHGAESYLKGMPFGLRNYYELYDVKKKKVVLNFQTNEKEANNK